ncbi:MAG: DEAD/DEAH box helicase [Pigmentiphaga sp.]
MAVPTLRPKQQKIANDVRDAFRTCRAVLVVAHTAFGKTVTLSYIVASARGKGRRVLILAHRQELISQISTALRGFGVEHGIISPQFTPNYREAVQVASVATMNARFGKIPAAAKAFDMIILDEAHHLLATNTFGKVYDLLGRPRIMGVTATPERADGKGLGEDSGGVFQTMVMGPSVRESIEDGYLSDFTVYAPPHQLDLSDVKSRMGDYDKQALAEKVDKPTVTGDAVHEYARRCPTYPAVVFCISIEHCKHVAAEFQASGFDFRVIDGTMDDSTRRNLIQGLGKTHLGLVSCDVISEGTDVPTIGCAIFLRPTKSTGLYIQQAGRAIRPVYADGYDLSTREGRLAALANGPKPKAILLDHAGLTFTHGFIDEEREWSLEGRKKGKGKKKASEPTVPVTQCKSCFAVFAPAPACPLCGTPVEVKARKVEQVDGQLVELTPEMRAAMSQAKRQEVKSAKSLADLERIGAQRGYSPGWARATYEAKQRTRAKYRRDEPPPPPSISELSQMTLAELEAVANQQGWPREWPSEFFYQQQARGGQ